MIGRLGESVGAFFSKLQNALQKMSISDKALSLNKECGWKGGDRGGSAQWE
jgi:hypothetical protein